MEIINSRQIIKHLLLDTDSRKIKWINIKDTPQMLKFVYSSSITYKKKLRYELISRREKTQSELNLYFGPIEKEYKLIHTFNIRNVPLLYDLMDSIIRKYNDGDINYIPENMSFDGLSKKPKTIRLINILYKNTKNDELKWTITSETDNMKIFQAKVNLTENKEIIFNFKTSQVNMDDNILKVLFKIKDKKRSIYSTSVIDSINVNNFNSLKTLIKILYNKYLGIDFDINFDKKTTKTIEVKDFNEYKAEILKIIKSMRDEYPKDSTIFNQSSLIYNAAEQTKDYNVLNDLLYKIKLLDDKYQTDLIK